ncbi:MAG: bifunctional riboflavin kinase/FAD synthetase [Burkholderia sp.]|nr:bifunctional riboflavin kinase/FAD synthetase [Burkholderia sp.]
MKIFRGIPTLKNRIPCVLTIGNFDGVHRGHQELLKRVRAASNAYGLEVCVMTFEPHPREFFNKEAAPARISTLRDKLEALHFHGVDRVIIKHFNKKFANQLPKDFVENEIVNSLQARWIIIGDDFLYGANRKGTFDTLKISGKQYGFEVEQMNSFMDSNGRRISSSSIRESLENGDLDATAIALGHCYTISGHVSHGLKLGRNLGFPTINIRITHKRLALTGVFVVQVHNLVDNQPLPGVASLGLRPTVEDSSNILLETHLLDWNGNAYGKVVRIEFLKKLRDGEKFNDLETLSRAISRDTEIARKYLAEHAKNY